MNGFRAPDLDLVEQHDFKLTRKESSVLRLILCGLQNKHIAERMCITESTVKSHVSRILKKTGTNNRTEAALLYLRKSYGFFDPEAGNPAA